MRWRRTARTRNRSALRLLRETRRACNARTPKRRQTRRGAHSSRRTSGCTSVSSSSSGDAVSDDRGRLALQFELVARSVRVLLGDCLKGLSVDEHLAGLRLRRQSRRKVRDVTDRGEIFVAPAADVAHVLLTARDSDPDLERQLGPRPDGLQERAARLDGARPVLRAGEAGYEERHDVVALDLAQKGLV